jgi:hypothetical protein
VICKEPLGPDAERRVRHEVAMLQRLRGVAGVGPIVLTDAGGVSLAGVARPLPADDLAVVAVGLARAVAGMHARGGDAPAPERDHHAAAVTDHPGREGRPGRGCGRFPAVLKDLRQSSISSSADARSDHPASSTILPGSRAL